MLLSCRAFTLLELLVVVTVIVIIIALLVPSLDVAMDHAQKTECLTRLRAIGQAIGQFTNEHNSRYPQYANWNRLLGSPSKGSLYGDKDAPVTERPLNRYLGYPSEHAQVKVAECPSDKGDAIQPWILGAQDGGIQAYPNCYEAYGTSYLGAFAGDWFRVKGVFGVGPGTGEPINSSKTTQITSTHNKLIVADWVWHANRQWVAHRDMTRWHVDPGDDDVRQMNVLFADYHASLFDFPVEDIEYVPHDTPPDPGFKWW
jgi:prepilin-type N-terminal cleavage/methylation domain-containing protein